MKRFRVTVARDDGRKEQMRMSEAIRVGLIESGLVRRDEANRIRGTFRDEKGRTYLEFTADDLAAVQASLVKRGLAQDGDIEFREATEPLGNECVRCGNVAGPLLLPVCPGCGFQDISACPVCGKLSSRDEYVQIAGDVFYCPRALNGDYHQVRFTWNEPLINPDGSDAQPMVIVRRVKPG